MNRLQLKSSTQSQTTPSSSSTTTPVPEYVNLCTPNKTYSIRQVQSSNSLHILTPSTGGAVRKHDLSIVGEEEEDVDMDRALNVTGIMTSIAKCGSTLELHTPPEGFSATGFLSAAVRVFGKGMELDGEGDADVYMQSDEDATTRRILDELFADIPVSRAQCESGWAELCGFVIPARDGEPLASPVSSHCWRPTAGKKLEVWKMIVDGAVLQGIDLGKQFLVRDLWRSVLDDEGNEPFPRPLFEAVVQRVRESGDGSGGGLKCECGLFRGLRV
jgi:sister chromatid cohesion protein DCC1